MTAPILAGEWTDANQRLLVAEFARLRHAFGAPGDAAMLSADVASARAAMPDVAAIDQLAESFGLSAFERDVLLVCAGVEMDAALAAQLSIASDGIGSGAPTFGVVLAALAEPHWSATTPIRPLRRWRLVELDEAASVVRGRLRIDERVLHYLAGVNYLDARLRNLLQPAVPVRAMSGLHREAGEQLCTAIERSSSAGAPVVVLTGDDALGQADVATAVATALELSLYVMRVDDMPTGPAELDAFATLWEREATLMGGALLVLCGAESMQRAAVRCMERLRSLVFISGSRPPALEQHSLRVRIDKPDAREQRELWQQALGDTAGMLNGTLDGIASQFQLSARTIGEYGSRLAPSLANREHTDAVMWDACRAIVRPKLDELAQRVDATARWEDLVLPEAQASTLRQIATHVRHRLQVHHEWGFADKGARGLGVTALFAGDSGTGKTMAAEVLARELMLDLYRIDLSAVVSKYIGETEKNLRRVFDAAEESGAILLFDEADALFGKRSEVKDSHDRYANIEVSYLLQRMEAYRGLAILTTNLKSSLDVAFMRRLRFVVQFPFPDQAMRDAIWQRAFPDCAPTEGLDFAKLARLNVTGGAIRNIAVNAAFAAAAAEQPVSMATLLEAAHQDASKRERSLSDAETRGWV